MRSAVWELFLTCFKDRHIITSVFFTGGEKMFSPSERSGSFQTLLEIQSCPFHHQIDLKHL